LNRKIHFTVNDLTFDVLESSRFNVEKALRDNIVNWYTGPSFRVIRELFYRKKTAEEVYENDIKVFDREEIPTLLLHGTTGKFFDSIKMKGLLPSEQYNKVYLTDIMFIANLYSYKAANHLGGEPIVFIVNVAHIKHKLSKGFTAWALYNKNMGIFFHREFTFEEPISPKRIIGWYTPWGYKRTMSTLQYVLDQIEIVDEKEKEERELLQRNLDDLNKYS